MTELMDAALRAHTERLLTGTGLHAEDAEALASGTARDLPKQATAAAAAIRDGWRTAGQTSQGQP